MKFLFTSLLIFLVSLFAFFLSPVRPQGDSRYTLLVSEAILRHGTMNLDSYFPHALDPSRRARLPYQLKVVHGHVFYNYPPGSSVLSLPMVAALNAAGFSAVKPDGSYHAANERVMQAAVAAFLMAILAVVFYWTALLFLPPGRSIIIALSASFGTQVWSTASRSLTSHTWGILLLAIVIYLLLRAHRRNLHPNPYAIATMLSLLYFVRPSFAIAILVLSAYVLIYHTKSFAKLVLTGAVWLGVFALYSHHFLGTYLPRYYAGKFMTFDVFWYAMAAQLISPSRGLLVFVPILLLIPFLLIRNRNRLREIPIVRFAIAAILLHLVLIAGNHYWWGGHCYGPRLATDLIPWFVVLAMAAWLQPLPPWTTIAGGLLLALSITINARGALFRDTMAWNERPVPIAQDPSRVWEWSRPQFLAGLTYTVPTRSAGNEETESDP